VGAAIIIPALNGPMDVLTVAIAGLLVVAAIGMFMGQPWAWWIIATMTTLAVAMSLLTVTRGLLQFDQLLDPNDFLLKRGGRLAVQSLILVFLLTQPVIRFVKVDRFKWWQLLLILIGAASALVLGLALWGRLAA
jgi:hypothetical protein